MDEKRRIVPVSVHEEVKRSFLDYAMSVIVSRALPDVRDGFKPVHRRILYAMLEMGSTPEKPHRKSARIVGEVLGKYHPHGDTALYEAMVRLAQDFSTRYPLVDGHGNFGSQDGDAAAAMRYTEARLSPLALELLKDLHKETVDFRPNFDESLQEPVVLPSRFPNLLANGSAGIAVGMATNIPPHNLGELIDALDLLIRRPESTVKELQGLIKGPDFPTGGLIVGYDGINKAYRSGRGIIRIRGRVLIDKKERNREHIVITELPYQQNKARLVMRIAELVKEKKIEGITDLRDESDHTGVRIVLELRPGFQSQLIINQLYQYTPLQQTYGIIMLALVNGEPRVLDLKEMLTCYLEHQKEVLERRTRFDLKKAEERLHIVEGLRIALSRLDEVIALIRRAPDGPSARNGLIELLGISEKQAQAILDLRLQRLTQLEQSKLEEEHRELLERIAYLRRILEDEALLLSIIGEELQEIRERYADERRTQIVAEAGDFELTDLILEEDVVITITDRGYIKRLPAATYRSQRRGGKGIVGMQMRKDDLVEQCYFASTHHKLLCFSNRGKVYLLNIYEIPEATRQARGMPVVNLLPLEKKEYITASLPIGEYEADKYLIAVTARGFIKKTPLNDYRNTRKTGLIAIDLTDDDELISVNLTSGSEEIIVGTDEGYFIRFSEKDVRPMGRVARGVRAVALEPPHLVIGADLVGKGEILLMVSAYGYGKRVSLDDFRPQRRAGRGLVGMRITEDSGPLTGFMVMSAAAEDFIIVTAGGQVIRQKTAEVSLMRRYARGVILIRLDEGDRVMDLIGLPEEEGR
ncbi:MAG: DNA gyrase subunit A [Firmicutes bacterium]|nr:DNA gyrase subunit A [Bacillota bacterium]